MEALFYRLYDWWPPVSASGAMGPNDFWNIDNGHRDRLGVFAEWERHWNAQLTSVLGVRHTRVSTSTAPVQGYSSLPTWADDAAAFNTGHHKRERQPLGRDGHGQLRAGEGPPLRGRRGPQDAFRPACTNAIRGPPTPWRPA